MATTIEEINEDAREEITKLLTEAKTLRAERDPDKLAESMPKIRALESKANRLGRQVAQSEVVQQQLRQPLEAKVAELRARADRLGVRIIEIRSHRRQGMLFLEEQEKIDNLAAQIKRLNETADALEARHRQEQS